MITWLIGLLAPTVGEKAARPVVFGILAALALLALWGGKCAYDARIIAHHEQKAELGQAKRERKADANLIEQKARDEAAADQRKKEIDNATRNIPDARPSARQRARVCIELRRQARKRGEPQPAC